MNGRKMTTRLQEKTKKGSTADDGALCGKGDRLLFNKKQPILFN
jgi:hypothetical protein